MKNVFSVLKDGTCCVVVRSNSKTHVHYYSLLFITYTM